MATLFHTEGSHAPSMDERIGPYKLIRELGHGGMGTVYEAVHTSLGQRVAIKRLHQGADDQAARRILREARALAALAHPGLPQVITILTDGAGKHCLVLEFIAGQPLAARLGHPLALPEAVRIGRQLADALQAAHARGIIHRDVKPANVMMMPDREAPGGERAKLLDFGIARLLDVPDLVTRTEDGLGRCGTAVYMSPEQCAGDPPATDRSDVYALGVVLYEMLCGQPPFSGAPSRLMRLHILQTPASPRRLRPDLPAALAALLSRMLAKPPTKRPSMAEVVDCLSRPYTPARLGTRVALRRGMMAAALGLGGVPCLFLACWLWLSLSNQILIPGARFEQGSYPAAIDDLCTKEPENCSAFQREGPVRQVELLTFLIDRTETPWGPYARWINGELAAGRACADYRREEPGQHRNVQVYARSPRTQGDCPVGVPKELQLMNADVNATPGYFGPDFSPEQRRFKISAELENRPAVMVTWRGALAYCRAHGKQLPTEEQWELAARSPENRIFPWGKTGPSCKDAVWGRSRWKNEPQAPCETLGDRSEPVDETVSDRTREGVLHMGGNVSEWISGEYSSRYPACAGGVCRDQESLDDLTLKPHIFRGGSFYQKRSALRSAGRGLRPTESLESESLSANDIGFRCGRSLETVAQPLRTFLRSWGDVRRESNLAQPRLARP